MGEENGSLRGLRGEGRDGRGREVLGMFIQAHGGQAFVLFKARGGGMCGTGGPRLGALLWSQTAYISGRSHAWESLCPLTKKIKTVAAISNEMPSGLARQCAGGRSASVVEAR